MNHGKDIRINYDINVSITEGEVDINADSNKDVQDEENNFGNEELEGSLIYTWKCEGCGEGISEGSK